MISLFNTWLAMAAIGFCVWLFSFCFTADENKMVRRWTLYTIFWPIGLLLIAIHACKVALEVVREILK